MQIDFSSLSRNRLLDMSRAGDQVGNTPALILIGLLGDFEPGVFKHLPYVALGPPQTVSLKWRARANVAGPHCNVLAERIFH